MRRGVRSFGAAKSPPNHVRFITYRCDTDSNFQSLQIDIALLGSLLSGSPASWREACYGAILRIRWLPE